MKRSPLTPATRDLRSYDEIAERMGLSPQRIQQIIQAVLRGLWRRGLRLKEIQRSLPPART